MSDEAMPEECGCALCREWRPVVESHRPLRPAHVRRNAPEPTREATIEELSGAVDGDLLPTAAELSGEPTREALVAGIREHIAALVPFVDTLLDLLSEPAYEIETEQVREAMVEAGLLFEEPHVQPCEIDGCGCDEEWAYLFKPGPALSKLRALLAPPSVPTNPRTMHDEETAGSLTPALRSALGCAVAAIGDAIWKEDGLDGAAGEGVLALCAEALKWGTFDRRVVERAEWLDYLGLALPDENDVAPPPVGPVTEG